MARRTRISAPAAAVPPTDPKGGRVIHKATGDKTSAGDAAFVLSPADPQRSDVRSFGEHGNLFVSVAIPAEMGGGTYRLPVRSNGYSPDRADVEEITLRVVVEGVKLKTQAAVAPSFDALIKSKDVKGLTALYAAMPGMTPAAAAKAAKAAIQ